MEGRVHVGLLHQKHGMAESQASGSNARALGRGSSTTIVLHVAFVVDSTPKLRM